MDDLLEQIREHFGVFTTGDAKLRGLDGKAIAREVRSGTWHRIRRGGFVAGETWRQADAETRHLIRAAAIQRSYGDRVAFSHTTAALLHGLDVWGLDLDRVHVTRCDTGAGRVERDVVHHEGFPESDELTRVGGWQVVDPARAALETGTLGTPDSAMITINHCLHRGLATPEELIERYARFQRWPQSQQLQVVLRLADARVESPGESRCLWYFWLNGVPMPELQWPVWVDGREHRVDFAWPQHRLLGEFDGRVKYGRLLKPGQRPEDALFDEKQREDAIRRITRCMMIRYVWGDLRDPRRMCQLTKRMLDVAA
ncbi:hypothetical protein D9V37_15930 [Nocardioides mangrovicus]|uniref:AbiEi antitoxin N-terminal domain-containing protein n=1 Tax=Nocardioides mangrovicus TaxID=2478913 RepID=A0A3L8NWX2_9ACTN|nr:type IV toxin-antitoxin system AbiEi family antitoxin domain-containing protein [Nocardioides mangrovicus]RLV47650.1 hypothetical protein D9V37_15930 [Nocardioides mangrovicus]